MISPDLNQLVIPVQLIDVNTILSPSHITFLEIEILGAGGGVTTVITEAPLVGLTQFVAVLVHVAVYVEVIVGVWLIDAVDGPAAPLIVQFTVPAQPEAVIVMVLPRQRFRLLGTISGAAGRAFT